MSQTAQLLRLLLDVYAGGLFVYVICSWISGPTALSVRKWLGRAYEPVLVQIRRVIKPAQFGGRYIDFTPLILLFAVQLARRCVIVLCV